MLILNIHIEPYLAQYAIKKYPSYIPNVVRFSSYSLMNTAILSRLKMKPYIQKAPNGNLGVMLNEENNKSKRTDVYNWISRNDESVVERMLRLDFDMMLHYYFDSNRNRKGIGYNDSAEMFVQEFGLEGLIGTDALLKKHVRWKKMVREQSLRKNQQTEMNF